MSTDRAVRIKLMIGKENSSEVLRFQIRSKAVLSPDEMELFELTQLAGVAMDPSVFKILLDLLKINVAPLAIMQMLKLLCNPQQQREVTDVHNFLSTSADSTASSSTTHHHHQHRTTRQRPSSNKNKSALGSSRLRDGRH